LTAVCLVQMERIRLADGLRHGRVVRSLAGDWGNRLGLRAARRLQTFAEWLGPTLRNEGTEIFQRDP